MNTELQKETIATPDKEGKVETWIKAVESQSLLPPIRSEVLRESLNIAVAQNLPAKFIMTLCPAFQNIEKGSGKEGGPTREIVPFKKEELPRLPLFAREMAAFVVGTEQILGVRPQILLIINDIFEPGVESRIANVAHAKTLLAEGKSVFHQLFQEVDNNNPEIWTHAFQKSIRVVMQSDFIKPLQRFGLPDHKRFVETLTREALDPQTDAFSQWLEFIKNTRADSLMSPKAWETTSNALVLHERVRFLVAMYWTDGLINPLLFKTIFRSDAENKAVADLVSPVFICGVTRSLQAEMEMNGVNFHLGKSSINDFPEIAKRNLLVPRPAIHVIRNTASWPEAPIDPFTFNGKVCLK